MFDLEGPPPPPVYVGWFRPKNGAWVMVVASRCGGKIECYEKLVRAVELSGGMGLDNELQVLLEGDRPQPDGYRDRMMRPTIR